MGLDVALGAIGFDIGMGLDEFKPRFIVIKAAQVLKAFDIVALQAVIAGRSGAELLFVDVLMAINAESALRMLEDKLACRLWWFGR